LLLKSHKLSSTSILLGGKEFSSFGLEVNSGRMLYSCSSVGCQNQNHGKPPLGDVVVVKRTQLTVRLVESRSGSERWNFSVGELNLDFSRGVQKSLLGYKHEEAKVEKWRSNKGSRFSCDSDKNAFKYEDIKRIKLLAPEPVIAMFSSDQSDTISWQHRFESNVAAAWIFFQGELISLNIFHPATVPALIPEANIDTDLISAEFSLFQGQFDGQSYVQLSPNIKKVLKVVSIVEDNDLVSGIVKYKYKSPRFNARPSKSTRHLLLDDSSSTDDVATSSHLTVYKKKIPNTETHFFYGDSSYILKLMSEASKLEKNEQTQTNSLSTSRINRMVDIWWMLLSSCLTRFQSVPIFITFLCCLPLVVFIEKYLNTFYKKNVKKNQTEINESKPAAAAEDQITNISETVAVEMEYSSRFLLDFEMLECLGRGGFGIVFKARNRIDGCSYAVKRILLPQNSQARQKMLREVRALATLDHRSIVRFYNAWDESPPKQWQEEQDKVNPFLQGCWNSELVSADESISTESFVNINPQSRIQSLKSIMFMSDDLGKTTDVPRTDDSGLLQDFNYKEVDKEEFVFQHPTNDSFSDTETQTEVTFENSSSSIVFDSVAYAEDDAQVFSQRKLQVKNSKMRKRYQSAPSKTEKSKLSKKEKETFKRRTSSASSDCGQVYLYIQMQLCKRESLRDWLQTKVDRDHNECLNIFKQILDAVIYIHEKNLIHRDLKPSNVFFSLDGVIKVGDFGLVTKSSDHEIIDMTPSNQHLKKNPTHTQRVGTQMYMAPEQMTSSTYTDKVDIFALGIILIELSNVFNTQMERISVLNNARTWGKFPEHFERSHPDETQLAAKMLNNDANQRPSAVEISNCTLLKFLDV